MKIENFNPDFFSVNGNLYQKGKFTIDYNDKAVKIIEINTGLIIGGGNSYKDWKFFTDLNGEKFNNYEAFVLALNNIILGGLVNQGPQGPQGIPGPVGPAGLTWRGSWSSGASYLKDDAVGYSGASYFCINPTSGTTTPNLATTNWALLASQGATGQQGAQGVQGAQGIQGIQGPSGSVSLPYKKYVAILNQSGTDAPVATILENTLGITPIWTRLMAGNYRLTAANTFTLEKTVVFTQYNSNKATLGVLHAWTDFFQISKYATEGTAVSDNFNLFIEVRVYN